MSQKGCQSRNREKMHLSRSFGGLASQKMCPCRFHQIRLQDAYDTMVLEGETQLLERLEALELYTGRPVFFGAETDCDKFCEEQQRLAKRPGQGLPLLLHTRSLLFAVRWSDGNTFAGPSFLVR